MCILPYLGPTTELYNLEELYHSSRTANRCVAGIVVQQQL